MLPHVKTILYCTQIGPNSPYVFRWAAALASQLGAGIAMLHVIEALEPDQEALVEGHTGKGSLRAVVSKQERVAAERLRKRLAEFCERVASENFDAALVREILVVHGHVRDEILRHVEATGADLVIMGAHTRSTLIDRLLGSTAQLVISACPVPVLVVQVPEGKQDLTMIDP